MATIHVCDMCGAHFDVTENLNEIVFNFPRGYADKHFDVCGECYDFMVKIVKSFSSANLEDIIKTLDGMEV